MIFLYKFYLTSFETVLNLYEKKMNLCYKNPGPFGNLPDHKTFYDESSLEIDLFVNVNTEPNGLRPTCDVVMYYYFIVYYNLAELAKLIVLRYSS